MKPIIAAFDFDGTLTYRDTLPSFMIYTHGYRIFAWKSLLLFPWILLYLFKMKNRQELKEKFLTSFYKGTSLESLLQQGKNFAEKHLSYKIRPEGLKRLRWHQEQGHTCFLISASIQVYLAPWASHMKFDRLICSQLEVDAQGLITGRLKGNNCWGQEKTKKLLEILGSKENFCLYAYGDSKGDQELLSLADFPYFRPF